jgi:hypothetical protein
MASSHSSRIAADASASSGARKRRRSARKASSFTSAARMSGPITFACRRSTQSMA